jgi:hypothetical protein
MSSFVGKLALQGMASMNPDTLNRLRQQVKDRRAIPFIGAGFSFNLHLPSWDALLDYLASELDYDPKVFRVEGDNLQLAEYYLLKRNHIGPLRSTLDRWFNDSRIDIRKSEQHKLLVDLGAPIIYTTNYDNWIERAHEVHGKQFRKVVTIDDMGDPSDDITQIIKFHGDFSSDESLVLAESHYFDRLALESALDVRLLSDMIGRSLLFIGYSFQDINMRYMWHRLTRLWARGSGGIAGTQPQSYYIGYGVGSVQRALLRQKNVVTIDLDPTDREKSLVGFLRAIIPSSRRVA